MFSHGDMMGLLFSCPWHTLEEKLCALRENEVKRQGDGRWSQDLNHSPYPFHDIHSLILCVPQSVLINTVCSLSYTTNAAL